MKPSSEEMASISGYAKGRVRRFAMTPLIHPASLPRPVEARRKIGDMEQQIRRGLMDDALLVFGSPNELCVDERIGVGENEILA